MRSMCSMRRRFLLGLVLVCAACAVAPVQPIGPTPAPTAALAATPTTPSTSAPSSPVDLSPYRAAMRPEFAAEIDRFNGAPQYQIDLDIAPDRTSFTAQQKVRYTNQEDIPLPDLYFSLFANLPSYGGQVNMQSVKIDGQEMTPQFDEDQTFMHLVLPALLEPGEAVDVELAYTGSVPAHDSEQGYNQFGLHQDVLTLPNFYPQIPVYDDEGWNVMPGPGYGDAVFSDTALYQLNITAPADQVIATSGVCEARAAPAGQQYQRCVSGPMRDFMIAMSPDYEVASTTVDGIKLNSYYPPDAAEAGQRGLQVMADAVRSFTARFGSYPFIELDLIATPTTALGIEYPGLIEVAAQLYSARPDSLTYQESTIAHEAAHQWWYSLVGNDQVDEPWLDEALTQFSTGLYYRDVYGAEGLRGFLDYLENRYRRVQSTPDDKRADLPVAEYSVTQYSSLVYGKAPLFFNALYETLGDEEYNQLLQEYFQRYRYSVAYPQDFLALAEKYAGKEQLGEMMEKWLTTP